jgi:putative acetyltransferase
MHETTPPEHVFALDLSELQKPDITVWTAWDGDRIAGVGALKERPDGMGEVKSMRTHPDHLRKGVGTALLERIIDEARARGFHRLSLETGRGPAFEPALAMYRKRGFMDGESFGDYVRSEYNQILHLEL